MAKDLDRDRIEASAGLAGPPLDAAGDPDERTVSPNNIVGAAVKVLDALRVICASREPVRAGAIARELGVSMPTAFRAAETLVASGFVRHARDGQGYLPSLQVLELGAEIVDHIGIKQIAREVLEEVKRQFGEPIALAVREDDSVVFIDRIEGTRGLRFYCDIGRRLPLHAGAAARSLLAFLPESEFEAYVRSAELEAFTALTRTDEAALRMDREQIRRVGYAVSIDEVDVGVSAVGVPIVDARDRVVAVMSVANMTARWGSAEIEARGRALREAAVRIRRQAWPRYIVGTSR
jgi:DNA-binding IclR family transcriptional regulator